MLKKEFHISFTLTDVGKALLFSPVIVVLVYAIICLPWESEHAPNWVQAIGSVLAILVAIWVAQSTQAAMKKQRDDEIADRKASEAIKLDAFIAEVSVAFKMLRDFTGQPSTVGPEVTAVFDRMVVRVNRGFDSEPDPERIQMIAQLRFNLSSALHHLQRCEGDVMDAEVIAFIEGMVARCARDRKLLGHCSGLHENYTPADAV